MEEKGEGDEFLFHPVAGYLTVYPHKGLFLMDTLTGRKRAIMKKVIKNVQVKNIRIRLTLYYSLLITAISALLIIIVSQTLLSEFRDRKNEQVLDQMQVISRDMEKKMGEFTDNVKLVKREQKVRDYLDDQGGKEDAEAYLQKEMFFPKGLKSLMIVNANQQLISSFSEQKSIGDIPFLRDMMKEEREVSFSTPYNHPFGNEAADFMDNSTITCCTAVRDESSYQVKGYILSNITRDYLFSGEREDSKNLFDDMYIISNSGDFIYRTGDRNIDTEEKIRKAAAKANFKPTCHTDEMNSYFIRNISFYPSWKIVGLVSNKSLMREINRIKIYMVLICLLGIVIVVLISQWISKKMTIPIYALKNAMASFESGEMPDKVIVEAKDELRYLVKGFNSMVEDMNVYINAMYNYGKEVSEAEILALKFQLESLQSQINPHFLYNTLNTVSYLAMKGQTEDIRRLIQALNQLLRSTLSDNNEFVSIGTEIEFLYAYMRIQDYRYPDLVTMEITCDETLKNRKIPKLILQPLVENSLLHGIFPTGEKGRITIKIQSRGVYIRISIEDNGVGMNPEILKHLDNNMSGKGFNRIGLYNVNERLGMYYGAESRLTTHSVIGEGTEISFEIPQETDRG